MEEGSRVSERDGDKKANGEGNELGLYSAFCVRSVLAKMATGISVAWHTAQRGTQHGKKHTAERMP